jgi:alkaline phosphatase D
MGRARTTPAPDASPDRLRFTFASCSNYQAGYFSAYRHIADENPDLVIFLGDCIYETTYPSAAADRIVRQHDGPTATDLPVIATATRSTGPILTCKPCMRARPAS